MIVYFKDGREPESYRASDYDICSGMLEITFKYESGGIIIPLDTVDHIETGVYFTEREEPYKPSPIGNDGGGGVLFVCIIFAAIIIGILQVFAWMGLFK